MKRISVVGLGFVGLSTAVYLAAQGYNVIASSKQQRKVKLIKSGIAPFFEPELEPMLKTVLKNKKLRAVVGRKTAVLNTDATFITVGTPSLSDGSTDRTFVQEVSKEIGEALKLKQSYHLIVVKSTVPPGTTENVVKPILEKHSRKRGGRRLWLGYEPRVSERGVFYV